MARALRDEPIEERLRELLAVEARLQATVRQAESTAAGRVEAARRDQARICQAIEDEAARHAAQEEAADAAAHAEVLAALRADHQRALHAVAGVTDARVTELARLALTRAIGATGGEP